MNRIPLLLLPGTLGNATLWQTPTQGLADIADMQVADLTLHDDIGAMAREALSLMPTERFALAGFSLGGYVALEIVRQAGDRLLGLALLNTSARAEAEAARAGREKLMALAMQDFPRLLSMLLPAMLAPGSLDDAQRVETIRRMMTAVGPEAFVRQSRAVLGRADSSPDMHRIACPTLIVAGAQDKVAPPALSQEMADAIAGAQFEILADTGHLAPMERPAEITSLLRGWLTRLGPPPR